MNNDKYIEENGKKYLKIEAIPDVVAADRDGDGIVSKQELYYMLEVVKKRLKDEEAARNAQRHMAWYSLWGMLLYPVGVIAASIFGHPEAANTLSAIAPTYFVSVAAIVAAFYGKSAYESGRNQQKDDK